MDSKKQIVKTITDMSGKYSPGIIFADWVQCMALAIQNACFLLQDKLWQKREQTYVTVINKYNKEEQKKMSEMFFLLTEAFDNKITDILGEIYMEAGCGSKQTGQFFTPFNLSKLTASVGLMKDVSEESPLILNEPSVGGGGMVIAAAAVLKKRGLNYQKCMKVTAQDLDWRSVYMAYVQFSILGIDAEVIQGDTLQMKRAEPEQILKTPKRMGMIL